MGWVVFFQLLKMRLFLKSWKKKKKKSSKGKIVIWIPSQKMRFLKGSLFSKTKTSRVVADSYFLPFPSAFAVAKTSKRCSSTNYPPPKSFKKAAKTPFYPSVSPSRILLIPSHRSPAMSMSTWNGRKIRITIPSSISSTPSNSNPSSLSKTASPKTQMGASQSLPFLSEGSKWVCRWGFRGF